MHFHLAIAKATPQLQAAIELTNELIDAGFETYLAGGWVRDLWLGRQNGDIDIATAAPLCTLQKLFPGSISVGASFGCLIASKGPWKFEVTTFRTDGEYLDGRHPIAVKSGSAQDDAQRRDFTINGLFYDIRAERIIDFVGGVEDLISRQVRCIGDPHLRFGEDKLRLLRCIRFASQLKFSIEPATKFSVMEFGPQLRSAVAKERVWQELTKLLDGPQSVRGCSLLYELGLAKALSPALPPSKISQQTVAHLQKLPFQTPLIFQLLSLWAISGRGLELLAHPSAINSNILSLFALSRQDQRRMQLWLAMQQLCLGDDPKINRFQRCTLYSDRLAGECAKALWPLFERDQKQRQTEIWDGLTPHIERMRMRRPLVDASLLQKRGIAPGPKLGHLLRWAEILAVELDLQTPQQVLDHLFKEGR